ncbi:MAG: fucose permease [Candidatus Promineifilaceae bacterium]|jgi:fucose permease
MKNESKKYSSTAIITISFLFLSFILLGMPGAITHVGWPAIRTEFGLRQDSIGLLLLMSTVGHLISGAFNGRLMYLLGGSRLLLLSLGIYSLSLFGYWLTPSWEFMVLLALIGGWSGGTLDATGNTIVAARFDERIMNWLHGFFGVGATLGPLVVSLVVAFGSDWRGSAFVFGTLLLIVFFAILIFKPLDDEGAKDKEAVEDLKNEMGETSAVSGRQTLSKFVVWLAIFFYAVYGGVEVSIGQWAFTIFTESRALTPELARLWVSIYWGTFTIGRFLFGWISHWLPVYRWIRICLVATTASVVLLLFPNQPILGILGLALSGLAQAPIFATLISNMPKLVGRDHASNAIGYVVGAAGIGLAIFPWLAGVLAEQNSLEVIPPYIFGLTVLLFVLFELMVRVEANGNRV